MGFDNFFHYLDLTLEAFFVNLLLSGDNAVMIALACRSLPPALTRRAMLIGIDGAIVLRVLLAAVASFLLRIPLLKLAGGIALMVIAIKLTVEEQGETRFGRSLPKKPPGLWSAVGTIIVADLVMSVDNVVALAAVAQGSIFFLAMGLVMSVPLLMYGSLFVGAWFRRYPLLKRGGGALLGWLAGDIAMSDPLITDWVNQQAPALTIVVPILAVVFVWVESRIMEEGQAAALALRPKARPKAAMVDAPPAVIERAPPPAILDLASQSVAAEIPAPMSAAETYEKRPHPDPHAAPPCGDATVPSGDATVPPGEATAVPARAPRGRFKLWVWIVTAVSAGLLWLFFKSLSLDFAPSAPPVQWTPPVGKPR
jgi:YjbE family integral membrane protein